MGEATHNHTRWRNDDDPWSPCPPSCPAGPGEDVRAEVREQIAEALHVTGTRPGFAEQDAWTRSTTLTDAVLAVPAVAEALALRGRVEALLPEVKRYAAEVVRSAETDALGVEVARQYRDKLTAQFAINDFRDRLADALAPDAAPRTDGSGETPRRWWQRLRDLTVPDEPDTAPIADVITPQAIVGDPVDEALARFSYADGHGRRRPEAGCDGSTTRRAGRTTPHTETTAQRGLQGDDG